MEVMVVDAPALESWLTALGQRRGAVLIPVRARPASRREGVDGLHDGALKIATTAPPDRGRANERIGRVLAGLLGLPPSAVTCVSGATSRSKTYAAEGLDLEQARHRLRESLS
jgi:uncharacterized protein YggU (UPF0235/DUF167 family)